MRKRAKRAKAEAEVQSDEEDEAFSGRKFDRDAQESYQYKLPEKGSYSDENIDSDEFFVLRFLSSKALASARGLRQTDLCASASFRLKAFDSADEDKYGDFFAGRMNSLGKKKSGHPVQDQDNGEADGGASDGEGFSDDGMISLSEMLSRGATEGIDDSGTGDDDSEEGDLNGVDPDEDEDWGFDDRGRANIVSSILGRSEQATRQKDHEERDEALNEGEFNMPDGDEDVDEVPFDTLLGALKKRTAYGELKKQVAGISTQNLALGRPTDSGLVRQADRAVAYDQIKKDISKWVPSVKANRESDHLSFPSASPLGHAASTSAGLVSKFTASTGLEKEVQSILEESSATERHRQKFSLGEQLHLDSVLPEERVARTKELQKLRALESFYSAKSKRIKKIKSKKYHQIKKKELSRAAGQQSDAEALKDLQRIDPEAAQDMAMAMEKKRAENRASLRHKNTSKWAKHMLGRNHIDSTTRSALGTAADIDRELRRRVTLESDDDERSDEEVLPEDTDAAVNELNAISSELQKKVTNMEAPTGINALKFMQRAVDRSRAEVAAEAAELAKELHSEDNINTLASNVSTNGRRSFKGPEGRTTRSVSADVDATEHESSDLSIRRGLSTHVKSVIAVPVVNTCDPRVSAIREEEHSKLPSETPNFSSNSSIITTFSSSSPPKDDSNPWLTGTKSTRGRSASKSTAMVTVDLDKEQSIKSSNSTVLMLGEGDHASEQRALIERAFAGDNVIEEEFVSEKAHVIDRDTPKDIDVTLPGWGCWGGSGPGTQEPKKRIIKKAAKQSPRADEKLKHVIITERKDKKAAAKMVTQVPFPFTSKQQFEKSIRQPVGREWNTASTFKSLSTPKVSTKAGTAIAPMSLTPSVKQNVTKRKSNANKSRAEKQGSRTR